MEEPLEIFGREDQMETAPENCRDPRTELVQRFFKGTESTYDAMVHYATFGIDGWWKRRIVELLPKRPERILDLACGTGISTLAIARRFPHCRVIGVELRAEYLDIARKKVQQLGLRNVEFVLSRAEDYRSSEPFDAVVSSYLAKYADLTRLIPLSKELLKAGGVVVMHDFTFPPKAYLITIWRLYFMGLQTISDFFIPAWKEIAYGLPKLIETTRWIPELTEALRDSAFQEIRLEYLTAYGAALVTARK
ncbi:MAG: class I SAM-dependent methyltransferase [Nitrospirota bacterium]|nr:class I SAM-dependent methyltransferase [Nitrospirota bacterium]